MIRVSEVRVIDAEGEQLGVMATDKALTLAQEQGLDLVEVSPTARPPVCRIMDFGKFKYEQSKKQRQSKKNQHTTHVKEVKMRPKTEEHDYQFKKRHAEEFLEKHHKVKFTVMFRGRELDHRERGELMLRRMEKDLAHVGVVERAPQFEGRIMIMYMAPKPGRQQAKKPAAAAEAGSRQSKEGQHAETEVESGGVQTVPENGNRESAPEPGVQEPHTDKENDET